MTEDIKKVLKDISVSVVEWKLIWDDIDEINKGLEEEIAQEEIETVEDAIIEQQEKPKSQADMVKTTIEALTRPDGTYYCKLINRFYREACKRWLKKTYKKRQMELSAVSKMMLEGFVEAWVTTTEEPKLFVPEKVIDHPDIREGLIRSSRFMLKILEVEIDRLRDRTSVNKQMKMNAIHHVFIKRCVWITDMFQEEEYMGIINESLLWFNNLKIDDSQVEEWENRILEEKEREEILQSESLTHS